jgi:preprotein translocase subunit SecA
MGEVAREELAQVVSRLIDEYTPGEFIEDWDLEGLGRAIEDLWPTEIRISELSPDQVEREELARVIHEDAVKHYDAREEELGEELMRALERYLLLQIIDTKWREHLYDMDYLREGIHLRGFAQIEPIVAYKNEAFDLFTDLMASIWQDFARMVFNVEVEVEGQDEPAPPPTWSGNSGSSTAGAGRVSYSGGAGSAQPSALAMAAGGAAVSPDGSMVEDVDGLPPIVETRHLSEEEQIGRNDPCWCGSGKKFKKCHGS